MAEYFQEDWFGVLRRACAQSSQAAVARRLGVCRSLVTQVLAGRYAASATNMAARVRGELMNKRVVCPVLGEISARRCQDEQRRPFASTSPQRVQLFRTCRSGSCGKGESCQQHP